MTTSLTQSTTERPAVSQAARLVPIGLLALGGFASGAGARLLDPLLPLVAGGLGVSVPAVSVLVAAFLLPYGLGQTILGPLGDRFGKVRVVCVSLLLYGAFMAACSAADGLTMLVALRAGAGLFAGAIAPLSMAYVGDNVPYEHRQATLGRFLTGMVMAQLLTGPLSGAMGEYGGWRVPFLVLGVYALGVAALLLLRFGHAIWTVSPSEGRVVLPGPVAYLRLVQRPVGRWLLLSAFFEGLCLFGGAFPYVGAFSIQTFGLTAASAGLIVAGFGVGSFTYTRFTRHLVNRLGETRLLLCGGLGIATGLIGLTFAGRWQVVAVAQIWLGLMFYMFHGVLQARATEALPEARGAAVSAFALALFVGQGIGALSFGGLLALSGYREGFAITATAMLLLTLVSATRLARLPRPGPSSPV